MITEIILAGVSFFQPQVQQQDSLGIETVNGKTFVIHKVSEKETLYGISRRYGATVDAVLEVNPAASSGLEIGQIIKVPYVAKVVAARPASGGGIIHVVAQKETMFSISKAYNVSIDEIKQWNNLPDNDLSIGQEIVIKRRNTLQPVLGTIPSPSPSGTQKGVHIVDTKETMYSIARQYNVTVDQIREWNSIQGNDLKVGQSLIVAKPGVTQPVADSKTQQTAASTTTSTNTTIATTQSVPVINNSQNATTPSNTTVTPSDKVAVEHAGQPSNNTATASSAPAISPKSTEKPIVVTETMRNADEISEGGLAELIEGTEGNRKYLALHRTAPVGSILKVKNEMNNREVFVRVTGKLPETALTEKVVIRISKSAYDRLGAIDPKFRVQVTYYK